MKFLIFDHNSPFLSDITSFFKEHAIESVIVNTSFRNVCYDPVFRREMTQNIRDTQADLVFSLQFFPILSNICEQQNIPYVCWCYNTTDNLLLLNNSIINPCNVIFHADSQWIEKLQRLGCKQVYYLPWAASSLYTSLLSDVLVPKNDVTCLDPISTDTHLAYLKLQAQTDPRTRGFLEGLLQAQEMIYGFNFLENACNQTVMQALCTAYPLSISRKTLASLEEVYAFELLYPAVTKRETAHLLATLDHENTIQTCLYTKRTELEKHFNRISVLPFPETPTAIGTTYQTSKINLLISSREIQNGVPAQAFQILGCGGFLLTNFQNDFISLFEPDNDYVYYESCDDMLDKIHYYLTHEDERNQIAQNARKKILQHHTFAYRMHEMFDILQGKQS